MRTKTAGSCRFWQCAVLFQDSPSAPPRSSQYAKYGEYAYKAHVTDTAIPSRLAHQPPHRISPAKRIRLPNPKQTPLTLVSPNESPKSWVAGGPRKLRQHSHRASGTHPLPPPPQSDGSERDGSSCFAARPSHSDSGPSLWDGGRHKTGDGGGVKLVGVGDRTLCWHRLAAPPTPGAA